MQVIDILAGFATVQSFALKIRGLVSDEAQRLIRMHCRYNVIVLAKKTVGDFKEHFDVTTL